MRLNNEAHGLAQGAMLIIWPFGQVRSTRVRFSGLPAAPETQQEPKARPSDAIDERGQPRLVDQCDFPGSNLILFCPMIDLIRQPRYLPINAGTDDLLVTGADKLVLDHESEQQE